MSKPFLAGILLGFFVLGPWIALLVIMWGS